MKTLTESSIVFAPNLGRAVWTSLDANAIIHDTEFAAGSFYKAFSTKDAGWVIFHPTSRTPNNQKPRKRFFRF